MGTQRSGPSVDVAVVGAGAAGLNAARQLHAAGRAVLVLEARHRTGGRVFTLRRRGTLLPIELGAEFVHGRADPVARIAAASALTVNDVEGLRLHATAAGLRRLDDFWPRIDSVLRRIPAAHDDDISLADFLARKPGGRRLAASRRLARGFVEGFHAADLRRISARSLRESGSPGGDEREQRLGRVLEGYDRIVDWLETPVRARIRTGCAVTRIDWRNARVVTLTTASGAHIRARTVLVTVPVGVLQAGLTTRGAIQFDPPLAAKRPALAGVAMGCVARIVLQFREPLWSDEQYASRWGLPTDQLTFLHGEAADFPVWWTAYPSRLPVITGWCGGPRAASLSALPAAELRRRAVRSLAAQLRMGAARLERSLVEVWHHDWNRDPYARGAYSYSVVGGSDAAKALAQPVAGRLFFAGEATDTDGATGTVHGAIASGQRAARQIERALRRR